MGMGTKYFTVSSSTLKVSNFLLILQEAKGMRSVGCNMVVD